LPLPDNSDLEALAADLQRLWNEPTTSPRDRKRILRTLINDVTLTSDPSGDEIRVGIRWRAGSHEEHPATRTRMLTDPDAIELIRRRKNEGMRDSDIAAELRALGLHTARGHEFGIRDVRNVRTSIGLSLRIPDVSVHLFRSNPYTDSDRFRTPRAGRPRSAGVR
jgi:hypothetical protein